MMEVVIAVLVLYLLYKIVFDIVVPVAKTTAQFKTQVNNLRRTQQQPQPSEPQKQTHPKSPASNTKNSATTDAEYIDFEELK